MYIIFCKHKGEKVVDKVMKLPFPKLRIFE